MNVFEQALRSALAAEFDNWMTERYSARPATPAFDLFWQLRAGVSHMALAVGLAAKG